MMDLSGVHAPLATPFDPVTGEIDVVALRGNARAFLDAGVSGLVLFGTTGEGWLVDEGERSAVLEGIRELDGGATLLAGVAAEATRAAIRLARSSAASGADGILLAPPSYYRPNLTPEALREHYLAVAEASPVPLVIYQVPPAYGGLELSIGLIAELSRHGNIAGVKDSTGNLQALGKLVESCRAGFAVLGGRGGLFYGALEVGAGGGILAIANIAPAECVEIYRSSREGRDADAGAVQERMVRMEREVVVEFGVPGLKAALDLLGRAGGSPRLPLRPVREKDREAVRAALVTAGLLD